MRKFYRAAPDQSVMGGIGSGLGKYFDIDPNLVRLAMIFIGLVTAIIPVVIMYIVAWVVFDSDPA